MRKMGITSVTVLLFLVSAGAVASAKDCLNKSNSKLICYYSKIKDVDSCRCSHVILPANSDVKSVDGLREKLRGVKILLTVHDFNEGLVSVVKNAKIDGLELNLRKLDSKSDISDFISTVRSKLGADLYVALSVPPKAELLAKHFDFKALSKSADLFILQTGFLGANKNVTFHPSRLSGLWDMQNADSVVDLVSGLGAPLSKLVLTAPVQALHFTLQDEEHTAPGSPALDVATLTRDQLCSKMSANNWTLERDQDQAGPYIFRKNEWIAFDDAVSIDIKAKYSRVRGLAGLALKDMTQDGGDKCSGSLLKAAFDGLSKQARAPRGAVLHSLEREILERPARQLENIHLSPYRISRVIDVEGKVHVIRQDTRTEFECSRQGYFVHPRSCGRFYRCVKFDQLTDEYSVFEFDCPAGLAFDSRVEVCVWPGSLPHASACAGSSEIAPVPKERFVCPGEQGYYADPENCRWFFACLDHGKSHMTAYEFRCPFGLVFDQDRLLCEWPWLVPKCASGAASSIVLGLYQPSVTVHGGHGIAGADFTLERYDGLGNLGRVTLGGVAGHIEQPVAKVYSSFGAHGAGIAGHGATLLGGSQTGHLGYVGGNGGIASGGANLGVGSGGSVIYHGNTNLASGINEGLTLNAGHLLGESQHSSYNGENSGIASGGVKIEDGGGASVIYHGNTNLASGINEGLTVLDSSQNQHSRYSGENTGIASGGVNLENGGGASVIYHGNTNLASGINEGLTLLDGSQNQHSSYSGENTGIASGGVNLENGGGASVIYHGNTNLASGINEGLTVLDGSQNQHSSYSGENTGISSGGAYLGASDGASTTYHGKTNLVAGVNDGLTGAFRGNVKYLSGGGQIGGNQQTGSYSYQNNGNEILKSSLHQGVNGYDASLGNIGTVVALQSSGIGDGKYLKASSASRGSTKYHGLATDSLQGGLNGGIASYSVGLENSKGNGGLIGVYDVGGEVSQSNDLSAANHGGNNLQSTVTYHGNNLNYAGDVNAQDSGLAVLTDGYNAHKLDNINQQQIITTGINGRLVDGGGLFTTGQHVSVDSSGVRGNNRYQGQSGHALDFSNGVTLTAPHGPADFSNVVVHGQQQLDLSRQNAAALNTGYVSTGDKEDYRGSDHVITGFSSHNAGINQGGVKTGIQRIVGEAILQNQGVQFYGNANEGHGVELLQNADVQIGSQNRGIAGNIDIIGGGFSAVKSGSESRSGVQVIQHGASVEAIEHVAPVPVSVTPSSISTANIPVVTSVPVPAIKTATGFDVYKGGVVANVPELQYKLDSPKSISNAFYQTQIKGSSYSAAGSSSFANPSSSLVGYASSTAAPILAATGGSFVDDLKIVSPAVSGVQQAQTAGYDYSKSTDSVSFINQQVEPVVQQVSIVQPTGSTILATHQTPATVFEERYQPVQPAVIVSQPVQPASYNYHQANHQSQGYVYNQPAVTLEKISQKPAVISSFSISQPSSAVPVEHVVPVQVVQQPQVVSSYDYEGTDQKSRGYIYKEIPQKPAVVSTFSISQSTTPAPLETVVPVHPVQQPSYTYQQTHHKSQGYVYERPNVVFEEQPQKPAVVSSFSFSQPVVGVPVHPAPISLQGYQHSSQHANDYLSNRSTVYFEQRPQAAVVSGGYNYVSPTVAQAEIQKATAQQVQPIQIESAHAYHNSAHSLDYDYSKSAIAVDENAGIVPVTVAPIATYTLQQPAEFQKNVAVNSYHYQRPSIQKTTDTGYVYPKPSVQFVEEPSPVITNYENFEPVREEPFVAEKAYVTGYQNTKPNVVESYSVSSTPAYQQTIYSTPKPPVTFASTYRPILTDQYVLSTPRPQIPSTHAPVVIEDYYVSSTPKPTFASTIASVISAKAQPITDNPLTFYSYDSRLVSTPKTILQATPVPELVDVPVTQSRPVSRYSFSSLDQNYNVASTPVSLVENAAPIIHESINVLPQRRPINRYLASTPISTVHSAIPVIPETVTAAPVASSVYQSRPISRYSFSSLDQNYNVASTPVSLVENAAPIIHESINVLPQRRPINRYLASTPISTVHSAIPVIPETVTAAPVASSVYQSRPISRYSFSSLDQNYNVASTPVSLVENAAPIIHESINVLPQRRPINRYLASTPISTVHSAIPVIPETVTAAPVASSVYQSRPISRYSFSSLDQNYNVASTPVSLVENAAPIIHESINVLPQRRPINRYLASTPISTVHSAIPVIPETVTAAPVASSVYQSRPISRYSFSSLDQNYNVASTPVSLVENAAPIIHESINVLPQRRPINRYLASTPISTVHSAIPVIPETVTVAPVASSVYQSRPISRYSFSSLDQNYNVASTPVSLVENAAPVIHESINVLPQRRPINRYLASTPISIVDSAVPVIPETATVLPAVPHSRYSFGSLDHKYNFVSTPATLVEEHAAPVVVTQSKPISRYSFSSLDDKYNNYLANQAAFVDVSSTPAPSFTKTEPNPFGNSQNFIEHFSSAVIPKTLVTDTRRRNYAPTVPTNVFDDERALVDVSTSVPIFSTTPRPISRYSFSSLDDNYSFTPSTATNVVVDDVVVSTPKTVVEVPGYLPPVQQYVENYEVGKAIKSRRPVKVVKLVRPKSQAIVKVNDFHPLLAAKLGAQCTCVSNTLRLKKKPVRVQIYDDDDVEEYVVKQDNNLDVINNDYSNLLTDSDLQQRTKIEDYQFEPEKVVEITPVPEIGTGEPILVRKRVRVRPYLSTTTAAYDDEFPVSKVTDIFLKSTAAPSIQIIDDDVGPDQKEVEDVVRKGLSLIKSAARQGTKEALAEHTYDRYGPGGVRSRDETLQGTIDCQRAGLFRHPTHCNKFYACRWDCTKNRYTLHVFNCPVHLTFDNNLGACNWPSQGPACLGNTLLPSE